MRVIVAVDGSAASKETIAAVVNRRWASDTDFKVLAVIPYHPVDDDDLDDDEFEAAERMFRRRTELVTARCRQYQKLLEQALPSVSVQIQIKNGNPPPEIIKSVSEWSADELIIGRYQTDTCERCVWGSVSRAVALRAACKVEIIAGSRDHFKNKTAC
jgi:nucleotide-binding universal stress UspA family protein